MPEHGSARGARTNARAPALAATTGSSYRGISTNVSANPGAATATSRPPTIPRTV